MSIFIQKLSEYFKFFSITTIFILIALISCRKEEPILLEAYEQCTPLPPDYYNYVGWPTYHMELPRQLRPCFNPNNSNEIIFQEDVEDGISGVYKYNLETKEKTLVVEGMIVRTPSWGINDWILLVFNDFNIWRIKPDGTGLEQLTTGGGFYSPQWNASADKFMTYTPWQPDFSYIHNADGIIVDSIPYDVKNSYHWAAPDIIVSYYHHKLTVYDRTENTVITEYEHGAEGSQSTVLWAGDDQIIWSNDNGIFTSNLAFTEIVHNVKSCNTRTYSLGAINPEKTEMIWTVSNIEYMGPGVTKTSTELQLFDIHGNLLIEDIVSD